MQLICYQISVALLLVYFLFGLLLVLHQNECPSDGIEQVSYTVYPYMVIALFHRGYWNSYISINDMDNNRDISV